MFNDMLGVVVSILQRAGCSEFRSLWQEHHQSQVDLLQLRLELCNFGLQSVRTDSCCSAAVWTQGAGDGFSLASASASSAESVDVSTHDGTPCFHLIPLCGTWPTAQGCSPVPLGTCARCSSSVSALQGSAV